MSLARGCAGRNTAILSCPLPTLALYGDRSPSSRCLSLPVSCAMCASMSAPQICYLRSRLLPVCVLLARSQQGRSLWSHSTRMGSSFITSDSWSPVIVYEPEHLQVWEYVSVSSSSSISSALIMQAVNSSVPARAAEAIWRPRTCKRADEYRQRQGPDTSSKGSIGHTHPGQLQKLSWRACSPQTARRRVAHAHLGRLEFRTPLVLF